MDARQKFFLLDQLAKRVKAAADAAKADLEQQMMPGDRNGVSLSLGEEAVALGAVTRTKPRPAWKVTDEAALTAWVEENHPERIERVPQVREWFVKSLLENAAANGAAITDDGEVIPGIAEVTGGSYVSAKPEKDAGEQMARLAAAGAFSVAELLQIEAPHV